MPTRPRPKRPSPRIRKRVPAGRVGIRRAPTALQGPQDGVQVSLRVFGTDLEPGEITRLLGADPTEAARTGTVLAGRGLTIRFDIYAL